MTIDNKGTSFSFGAATGVYGDAGGDRLYPVCTGGSRLLGFSDVTSVVRRYQSVYNSAFRAAGSSTLAFEALPMKYNLLPIIHCTFETFAQMVMPGSKS